MIPPHLFFPFFVWLLFNRTKIFQNIKPKVINWLAELENTWPWVEHVRYVLTGCPACFGFWCNLILCSVWGGFVWIPALFILTFYLEMIYYTYQKRATQQ